MSKLVKTVTYPFTGEQRPLTAQDHRLIPSREDVLAFYKTHERLSWSLTELLEIPWTAIDVAALTPADIFVVESALLVESNNPDYVANLRHGPAPGELDLGEAMATLRERLPDDTIVTNGAGNFSNWAHRFYEFRRYRTQLAPCSGAMGYGIPAAIAAKVVHPERMVVCVSGDGDF